MTISKYTENGKEYWKVYVHIRSKFDRSRRIQRTITKIPTVNEARREEKKLLVKVARELGQLDGLGLDWDSVVHVWKTELYAGHLGKITVRSAEGYLSIIYKWTKHWDEIPAAQIGKPEGRVVLSMLEQNNIAWAYKKKVRNIINKVYEWGIEFGHIVGPKEGPMRNLLPEKGEEKVPDILSLEEIKKFLTAAKALSHHWYSIWVFAVLTGMRSGSL